MLFLDGAGWHQTGGKLKVPDNLSLLRLPPYSPELNPTENIWQYLRQNYLGNRVFESYDAIVDACCEAWSTDRNTNGDPVNRNPRLGSNGQCVGLLVFYIYIYI